MIPPDAAAWIRDHVLPAAYRRNTTDPAKCPCQWGSCGHCTAGHHDQCPRTRWAGHGKPDPETYIVSPRSWGALTPVWRSGTACRWLCPCQCATERQGLFPAPARVAPRSSTAGGNGYLRVASTDRLHRDDADQPDLFASITA